MLYIFRYFKEIQKSIFVIKTMFETFNWSMLCEKLSYVFIFFFSLCHVSFAKSPCYTKAALLARSCPFCILCVFVQCLYLKKPTY